MGDLNERTIVLRQTLIISVLVAYVILFMATMNKEGSWFHFWWANSTNKAAQISYSMGDLNKGTKAFNDWNNYHIWIQDKDLIHNLL